MSGKYLLDTNIVIALFADDDEVKKNLQNAQEIFIPAIVIGELYYGAERSGRVEHNTAIIDRFREANSIIACDDVTASVYGSVKSVLANKGRPIPENDIWIAAMAIQYEMT